MTFWTSDNDISKNMSYLAVYSFLTVSLCFFVAVRTFIICVASYSTARKVHRNMIHSLLYAPFR